MTRKLTPWKSPTTDIVIQTVPVSMVAISEAMKRDPQWAEPEPPVVEVEIGGIKQVERNWADPDYPKAIAEWEQRFNQEASRRVIKRIALVNRLTDEQKMDVKEWRELLDEPGASDNDKLFWLLEIAVGSDRDLQTLVKFVTGQADPQAENIEKKAVASD